MDIELTSSLPEDKPQKRDLRKKISEEDRHAIYILRGCISVKECALRFKITESSVRRIQHPEKYEKNKEKRVKSTLLSQQKDLGRRRKVQKTYHYRKVYGIIELEDIKPLSVWLANNGERVIIIKGKKRPYLCDENGNIRDDLKLAEKISDGTDKLF